MIKEKKSSKLFRGIVFVLLTAIISIGAARTGYKLTQRYKSTITNAYDNVMNTITDKIDKFQGDILDEESNLEEK